MPVIDREGIFKAAPGATVSIEEKESGAIAAVIQFTITHSLENGQWTDWAGYGVHAYHRAWIVKKDGTVNMRAVETLHDVLNLTYNGEGITGDSPAVQITVKNEPYEGKDSFKVAWVNPLDYQPGPSVDPAIIAKLNQLHGAKLRAAFGSKPAPVAKPAKPPASPVTPSAKSTLPPPPPAPTGCTRDEAWAAIAEYGKHLQPEDVAAHWQDAIRATGKDEDQFTPADWLALKAGARKIIPF